jgi:hypothetical protein
VSPACEGDLLIVYFFTSKLLCPGLALLRSLSKLKHNSLCQPEIESRGKSGMLQMKFCDLSYLYLLTYVGGSSLGIRYHFNLKWLCLHVFASLLGNLERSTQLWQPGIPSPDQTQISSGPSSSKLHQ